TQSPVHAFGLLTAAAGVVIGAPLFAWGLRALRLRHALAGLSERSLDSSTAGLALVHGRVSLEGPLFAPLSGKPCAGFSLEVRGAGMRVGGVVHELRPFRLTSGGVSARVVPERAEWRGAVTCERTLAASETPPRDALEPPAWRLALLVLGPLLTLAGLLYLARAAAPLVAGRL